MMFFSLTGPVEYNGTSAHITSLYPGGVCIWSNSTKSTQIIVSHDLLLSKTETTAERSARKGSYRSAGSLLLLRARQRRRGEEEEDDDDAQW